jgi:hypothetical protein
MQPHNHQAIIDRFAAACQKDKRVVAAFLGGSYAKGMADAYSDLDLYLITTDQAYEEFFRQREAFIRLLGEPVFLEDFNGYGFDIIFFILTDGTEAELGLGRESQFRQIHGGPYKVLLDKKNILAGTVFPEYKPVPIEQAEKLRSVIYWFWHDLSHFVTAMGRGQLWWAYGQLEELRRYCVNLARLRHDFSVEAEGYEKVDQAIPVEQLSSLRPTFVPMEQDAMLKAALAIVHFYQELAPHLAEVHAIPYPAELERVMVGRLSRLLYRP